MAQVKELLQGCGLATPTWRMEMQGYRIGTTVILLYSHSEAIESDCCMLHLASLGLSLSVSGCF